jgi:hypothetical protein
MEERKAFVGKCVKVVVNSLNKQLFKLPISMFQNCSFLNIIPMMMMTYIE